MTVTENDVVGYPDEWELVASTSSEAVFVVPDTAPEPANPLECDGRLVALVAAAGRYTLGNVDAAERAELLTWLDEEGAGDEDALTDLLVSTIVGYPFYVLPGTVGEDREPMLAKVRRFTAARFGSQVVLPLYLLDHSGLAVNTTGFGCPWDSGQVGWVFDTAARVAECGWEERSVAELEAALVEEVAEYNSWLSGDVWGVVVTDVHDGVITDEVEAVWGITGYHAAVSEAKSWLCAVG